MTTTEIPIWVSGKQLWVSGVGKKTTVNDVIETLLGHPSKDYCLIEKWRRVERPLNADTKILKLWKTWGDARNDVKLSLRKAVPENDSGRSSPSSYTSVTQRRKKHKSICKYGQTIHPKRLSQLSKTQNIERLLKLILIQGETIQNQISRLKDKDSQIEYLEAEQHRNRVKSLGSNYVLETYLGGGDCEDDKEDSGVVTECAPSSENTSTPTEDSKDDDVATIEEDVESEIRDLQNKIHLLEKVAKMNKKLEKEEENLVRLYINVERCRKNDKLVGDLTSSLEQLMQESNEKELQLRNNYALLQEMEEVLNARKCYLSKLQIEINKTVSDEEKLSNTTSCKPDLRNDEIIIDKKFCSLPPNCGSSNNRAALDTLV